MKTFYCVMAVMRLITIFLLLSLGFTLSAQTIESISVYGYNEGIPEDQVHALYLDTYDQFWAAGKEAVYRMTRGQWMIVSELTDIVNAVDEICEDETGRILFRGESQVHLYDGRSVDVGEIGAACATPSTLPDDRSFDGLDIKCFVEGAVGEIILGTTTGVYVFERPTGQLAKLSSDIRLSDTILAISFDHADALWISTASYGLLKREIRRTESCFTTTMSNPHIDQSNERYAGIVRNDSIAIWGPTMPFTISKAPGEIMDHAFLPSGRLLLLLSDGALYHSFGDTDFVRAGAVPVVTDRVDALLGVDSEVFLLVGDRLLSVEESSRYLRVTEVGRVQNGNLVAVGRNRRGDIVLVDASSVEIKRGGRSLSKYLSTSRITASEIRDRDILIGTASGDVLRVSGKASNVVYNHNSPGSEPVYAIRSRGALIRFLTDRGLYQGVVKESMGRMSDVTRLWRLPFGKVDVREVALSESAAIVCSEGRVCQFGSQGYEPMRKPPNLLIREIRLPDGVLSEGKYAINVGPFYAQRGITRLAYSDNTIGFAWSEAQGAEGVLYYQYRLRSDMEWSAPTQSTSIQFSSLAPGAYTFEVRACYPKGSCTDIRTWQFVVELPFWRRPIVWAATLVLVLLLLGTIVRLREARIRDEGRRELEVVSTKLRAVELEQKLLQLQMNPHFLFNVMQTLQDQIESGSVDSASQSLTKLAKVMRQMLDMSRSSTVSLETELDFLRSYVEIEELIRGEDIEFDIVIQDGVEPFGEMLPSMMLQPVIENAIQHGQPPVRLEISKRGRTLDIEISDHGPGFPASDSIGPDALGLTVLRDRISQIKGATIRTYNRVAGGAVVEMSLRV